MSGNIIYHDGTILKGYCNNFKKIYANQLYYLRDFILKYGVDDKYGMIAVYYITQSPNDKKELLVTVNELNERLGREDYVIVQMCHRIQKNNQKSMRI